jgi:hypothetical protein
MRAVPVPVSQQTAVFHSRAAPRRAPLPCPVPWLGWAYLAKTPCKQQRGGVNFDPPMIFCACSMPNAPAASEMPQGDFRTK